MGAIGAGIGSLFGNPMLGFSIGMTLGGLLFPEDLGTQEMGRLQEIRVQGAAQGTPIPKVFGTYRIAGTIIETSSVRESFTTESSGGGSGGPSYTTKTYHYETDIAILVADGELTSIDEIWANQNKLWDGTDWDAGINSTNVHVHLGDNAQAVDAFLESLHGVGSTPAYRGFAYIVLVAFNLDPYGGQPPNFTFTVNGGDCNAKVISDYVCAQCGLLSSEYDFSDVETKEMLGFVIPGRTEGRNILDHIAQPMFYRVVEVDGEIKPVVRGGSSVATIDVGYLGAQPGNEPTGDGVITTRQQEIELPYTITLNYPSATQDYNQMSQEARRLTRYSQQETTLSYNIVFTDNQAKQIAETFLFSEWVQRMRHTFISGWRYLWLSPGDIVTIPTILGNRRAEILEISTELMGPVQFNLVEDDASVYYQTAVGAQGNSGIGVELSIEPYFFVDDLNAIFDRDADFIGWYASCTSIRTSWPGAIGYCDETIRADESWTWWYGGNTVTPFDFTTPCVMGEITGTPANIDVSHCVWDDVNTFDILIYRGQLSSAANNLAVYNGANILVIGKEILQFRDVTYLGSGVYRISHLLRGRRGTEEEMALGHNDGDRVTLVTPSSKRFNAHMLHLNDTIGFRPVEKNRYYSVMPSYENVLLEGRSRKPYSPCLVAGTRDGSLNLTITWVRRARKGGQWEDHHDVPLDEPTEKYVVDIYDDSSYTTIIRTITGITVETCTYSVANQITDFGSAQSTVYAEVFQYSDIIGKGFGRKAAI